MDLTLLQMAPDQILSFLSTMEPQQLASFITGLMGVIGAITAIIKQQTAKKETAEVKTEVHDLVTMYDSVIANLNTELTRLTSQEVKHQTQIKQLQEAVAKCERENTHAKIDVAEARHESRTITRENIALMEKVAAMTEKLEKLTEALEPEESEEEEE